MIYLNVGYALKIGSHLKNPLLRHIEVLHKIWSWLLGSTDNLATLIGYLFTAVAIFVSVRQLKSDQKWKRREAIISRVIAFGDTPGVHNAFIMLDWPDREISIWDHSDPATKYERVQRTEVALALLPPSILPINYKQHDKGAAIRDSFEDLFIRLLHIEVFLKADLIEKEDIKMILQPLRHFLERLRDSQEIVDQQLFRHLKLYMEWKQMKNLVSFFKRFEIDMQEDLQAAENIAIAQVMNGIWQRPV